MNVYGKYILFCLKEERIRNSSHFHGMDHINFQFCPGLYYSATFCHNIVQGDLKHSVHATEHHIDPLC